MLMSKPFDSADQCLPGTGKWFSSNVVTNLSRHATFESQIAYD